MYTRKPSAKTIQAARTGVRVLSTDPKSFHARWGISSVAETRSLTGRSTRRLQAANPTTKLNKAIVATTEKGRMPNGVKFRAKTSRGPTTMLRPKDSSKRSIQSMCFRDGKRAATRTYPGVNRIRKIVAMFPDLTAKRVVATRAA